MKKATKDTFRIESIDVEEKEHYYLLGIKWFSQDSRVGFLGKYSRAIYVPDIEKLEQFEEKYYSSTFEENWEFVPREDNTSELKRKTDCSFDLGLEKIVDIRALDVVEYLSENTFQYKQYISKCAITKACIEQLHRMKQEIETGYCMWGDYPDQAGAFRSGSPYDDFIATLETLDRFWD